MATRLEHDLTYDDASADDVAAMLADPAFREEVCEQLGVISVDVTVETVDGAVDVVVDQVQTAQGIPSFAKKFVGDEINIVQREVWTDGTADVTVTIPGKPGSMTGSAVLREQDGTTTEHVDLTIKVNIPLVGGKIEKLISDMLVEALETENRVGRDYLAR